MSIFINTNTIRSKSTIIINNIILYIILYYNYYYLFLLLSLLSLLLYLLLTLICTAKIYHFLETTKNIKNI